MFDKRLIQLCPESRKYILGNILFQWIELCMNAVMIFIISSMMERIYRNNAHIPDAPKIIGIFGIIILVRFATTKLSTRMSHLASKSVKKKLRERIFDKLLNLGLTYKGKVNTSELLQQSVEGVEQLESYFGLYVPQFFYAFLAPLTLFILFSLYGSMQVGLILLICVPLIPGAIVMVQKFAKKLLSKYWGQYTQLGSSFLENLQGMTTLKIYQADDFKNEQMNKEAEHFRKVTMAVLTMQLNSIIIMDTVAYGGAALGIIFAGKAFLTGKVSLSACIFMILLSSEFFLPMRRLGSYFHIAMNGMAASDKIFKFLDTPCQKDQGEHMSDYHIQIKNLSFSYTLEKGVLKNIDMDIPKKSFIGIVGESGSGKSTIAGLLTGKYHTEKGTIYFGNQEIHTISEESLMKSITYIGFQSFFFKGSVRDNLSLACKHLSDTQIWNALSRCKLDTFLRENNGLDTLLQENASNLSGGQRQRLALARAVLHDSPIYIFDEATSNIDIESEEDILQEILQMAKEKTVIMISHRLFNVMEADVIYCMKDGQVAEFGTHKELMKHAGTYHTLFNLQNELESYGKNQNKEVI